MNNVRYHQIAASSDGNEDIQQQLDSEMFLDPHYEKQRDRDSFDKWMTGKAELYIPDVKDPLPVKEDDIENLIDEIDF